MSDYSCLNLSKFKSTHENTSQHADLPVNRCETAQQKYSELNSEKLDKETQIMFGASALGQSALGYIDPSRLENMHLGNQDLVNIISKNTQIKVEQRIQNDQQGPTLFQLRLCENNAILHN